MIYKTLVTEPTTYAVSLNEAKNYCRIECDDDNNLLKKFIDSARLYCEAWTKRRYEAQTWKATIDKSEIEQIIYLENFDVDSVSYVKGFDDDDSETTFTLTDDYKVYNNRIILDLPAFEFRNLDSLVIEYVVGSSETSRDVKDAINMLVLHWYENRESVIIGTASDIVHGGVMAKLAREVIYTV